MVACQEAYCPHLGAHLGVGGEVEGDCIRCPFHGWAFDRDATNVDIPYAEREQDIPIWEAKRYVESPALAPSEGPIMEFRRWFKQFSADAA